MKLFALLFLAVLALASGKPRKLIPLMPTVTPNPGNNPIRIFNPYRPVKRAETPGTTQVAGCGLSAVPANSRIVNGVEATPHEFPWQVALVIDDAYFCGGSLISTEWVLTAGHCTIGFSSIVVTMGAHNKNTLESTQVTMTSTDITPHPDYGSIFLKNDVGLVRLPQAVQTTANIVPICLPNYSVAGIGTGVMLTASGWGITSEGPLASTSPVLRKVSDPSISNTECSSFYGNTVTDATICTGTSDGNQGTCSGDSGGPLMLVVGGLTYSRGVTSFVSSAGCASGNPDGFTRTSHYLDWIESVTGIAIDA